MEFRKPFFVIAVNILILIALLFIIELTLRWRINYNPSYYSAVSGTDQCLNYPYGQVCLNSLGFPDDEFDLQSSKPRIGYIGDSVCFGVGAGQGFRIPDLLEERFTEFEHWSFCNIGNAGSKTIEINRNLALATEYELDSVVYLMNLNDILPDDYREANAGKTSDDLSKIKRLEKKYLSWLRGRSYLYTYVRNVFKNSATAAGYAAHGYFSYELFPVENEAVLRETAQRINYLSDQLKARDVTLQVVILPYEMQISEEAAARFKALGVQWDESFLNGGSQAMLMKYLDNDIPVYNALEAFQSLPAPVQAGAYFVHDKGDKLDWNHPNREGHALITEYLSKQAIFSPQ
jgi:hypothetical protein